MTRAEALKKLLALGGLTEPEAWQICGWPRHECSEELRALVLAKEITYSNMGRGMRIYHLK